MEKDTCVCPNCNIVLDVYEYGYNLECSNCKCKIDVFPDTQLYLETQFGTIGIATPKETDNRRMFNEHIRRWILKILNKLF